MKLMKSVVSFRYRTSVDVLSAGVVYQQMLKTSLKFPKLWISRPKSKMLEFEAGLAGTGGQQLDKNKLLKTNEKTF